MTGSGVSVRAKPDRLSTLILNCFDLINNNNIEGKNEIFSRIYQCCCSNFKIRIIKIVLSGRGEHTKRPNLKFCTNYPRPLLKIELTQSNQIIIGYDRIDKSTCWAMRSNSKMLFISICNITSWDG